MRYLKQAWRIWSNILTFEWLDQLSLSQPRLAYNIKCVIWSAAMGIASWYQLDPRIRIYERNRYVDTNWTFRIVMGLAMLAAALAPLVLFIAASQMEHIELGWARIRKWLPTRPKPR